MARNRFRILAAGLGAFAIPACVTLQADINSIPTPATSVSPTAGPVAATSTVRRTDPPPASANMPVQYIAVPADQLVRDASGRTMVKASAIPAGYTPVAVPPGPVTAQPVAVTAQSSAAVTQVAAAQPAAPPVVEAMDVIALSHTNEPPLAVDAPKKLPAAVKNTPDLPAANAQANSPVVSNNTMPMVNPYPSTAQVLVLKDGMLQPINFNSSDPVQNLIMPPSPPEELKMISQTKLMGCTPTPLQLALTAYQAKQPADADKQLAGYDPVNRELLKKVLPIAARLSDANMSATETAEVADMVDQLQQAVRTKATLRIDKLCYCRLPAKPAKLGVYQPLADDHCYRIGETVELYMELRNFSCEAKEREYQTHLATVVEVRDERKEVVARYEFERDRPDVAPAQKYDYFHICRFPVQGLPMGQYTLNVTVTDVPTGKSATKSLPLKVDAARRVARGTAE